MKALSIGENYGSTFGLRKEGQAMIYLGGNSWKMVCPINGEKVVESEKSTVDATNYINKSVNMGAKA